MAKRRGVVTWNFQDVRRVSAESAVDVRTITRALAGDPIRPSSKTRIRAAAEKLKLRIPVLLFALGVFGCTSESQNGLFGGSGGAEEAGLGGNAGSGGAAGSSGGEAGSGGLSGSAGAAGESALDSGPPEASTCAGTTGGFMGCQTTGCLVCTENVIAYPKYFANHPSCTPLGTCIVGVYGVCSDNCPKPTDADQ